MTLDVEDNEEQNLIRIYPQYAIFYGGSHMDPLTPL